MPILSMPGMEEQGFLCPIYEWWTALLAGVRYNRLRVPAACSGLSGCSTDLWNALN